MPKLNPAAIERELNPADRIKTPKLNRDKNRERERRKQLEKSLWKNQQS